MASRIDWTLIENAGSFSSNFSLRNLVRNSDEPVFDAVVWVYIYVKKPEWPVLCTGMNGSRGFGGMCPQFNLAFSLEEAPTFGRDSLPLALL